MIEQSRIVKYLCACGAQHSDAEDAAQEALTYCIEHQSRLDWPLVIRVAKNKWIDILRKHARETPMEDVCVLTPDKHDHPHLLSCLSRLSTSYREALHERYWLNLSPTEAAQRHGIKVQSQKNKLQRAKRKLRELMAAA